MWMTRRENQTSKRLTGKASLRNEVGETHCERLLFIIELWLGERRKRKNQEEKSRRFLKGRGSSLKRRGSIEFFLAGTDCPSVSHVNYSGPELRRRPSFPPLTGGGVDASRNIPSYGVRGIYTT
jgi:hypothetical protein